VAEKFLTEKDLASLARGLRKKAGITRAQAARDMQVSQTSIFHAEESPELSLFKLRSRMIEAYSQFKVTGPVFYLEKK
jgi:DNA-binding XRE family transcriptional regulator